jgi:uncharacterized membrane protein
MAKKLKKFLTIFWWLLGLSLFVSIVYFIANFWNKGLSGVASNWGVFGDYFGGITQSIIALANLIVFVKLTTIIARYQQNQSNIELSMQKKILLTQLRSDAVKNISEKLNSFFEVIKESEQKKNGLMNLAGHIDSFCKNNGHLFQLQAINNPIVNSLTKILKCYDATYPNPEARIEDLKVKTNFFYTERDNFIRSLQEQMIHNLD